MSIFFRWVVQPPTGSVCRFVFVLCAQMYKANIREENSRRQESLQLKERSLPSSLVYLLLGVPNRELDTNKHQSPLDPKHVFVFFSSFVLFFILKLQDQTPMFYQSYLNILYIIYRHDIIIIDAQKIYLLCFLSFHCSNVIHGSFVISGLV